MKLSIDTKHSVKLIREINLLDSILAILPQLGVCQSSHWIDKLSKNLETEVFELTLLEQIASLDFEVDKIEPSSCDC